MKPIFCLLAMALPAAAGSSLCGSPGDRAVAAGVGLSREWVVQVPFDSASSRLQHVTVSGSLIVAEAGDGTVAAIASGPTAFGARPGTVLWKQNVGPNRGPITPVGIGPKVVTVLRGYSLMAYEITSGSLLWERELPRLPSRPSVSSGGWIYTPLQGSGFARHPEDPWADPAGKALNAEAEPTATDDARGDKNGAGRNTSDYGPRIGERLDPITIGTVQEVTERPLAYENGIAWVDKDGAVGAILRAPNVKKRLRVELGHPPSGPPVILDGDIIVASQGGEVVRLDRLPDGFVARSGKFRVPIAGSKTEFEEVTLKGWYAALDEMPESGPLAGRGTVIISLGPAGMVALSAITGDVLWRVRDAGTPVAIVGDRVWVFDACGFLAARDLTTGVRRERLRLGCFTMPVVNTASDKLVLASPGGLVVSLVDRRSSPRTPVEASGSGQPQ